MCEHYRLRMFLGSFICYLLSNIQVVICAQVTLKPQNVTISAGMEATFQCIVKLNRDVTEGELTYDVGWFSGGILIAQGNSIVTQNNRLSINRTSELKGDGMYVYSTLKITKVKHAEAGRFTCSIIKKWTIQASAWLIVKPQCMPLPRSVTITDVITLSCITGPTNYDKRLKWYAGDSTDENMNGGLFTKTTDNSYLNITVAVKDYVNGTIFKCKATETCSTNPLNIVENEPRSLDVKVHAHSPLPLTVGKRACFDCKVSCDVGECFGLIEYTWTYDGSAKFIRLSNQFCFISVPLNDDGQTLRCSVSVQTENGVGEFVLQVMDTMTTPHTEIQSQHPVAVTENTPPTIKPNNNGINTHLKNDDDNLFISIAIVVIIIIILIILGLLFFYRKHKLRLRENINKTDEELHVNKTATQAESQNNPQLNSLSLDATQMYAKVQKVNNLTTEKQNVKKLATTENEELNLMYESLEMNNLDQGKSVEDDISDLYAKVDKTSKVDENVKRSPVVTHWQSSSGDVYACVQKNKASTLPADQRRPASKHLPSTKPKLLKATANQETTSPITVNNTHKMTTYRNNTEKGNEMAKTDNNDRKSQNERTTKENLDKKVTKQKASTMSPSSGHDSMSVDAQGLHYADLEFTNDPAHQSISPQTGGVIYADITKQ